MITPRSSIGLAVFAAAAVLSACASSHPAPDAGTTGVPAMLPLKYAGLGDG